MVLSKKIFLASSVCAAFLAIGIGCSVEERDLEQKHVFLCMTDADCLEGNVCDGIGRDTNGNTTPGRCVRIEDLDHCEDKDGDQFYVVKEGYGAFEDECGFTNEHPKDPDDNDILVFPGASEMCDGKDNSGDGCVDGNCDDPSGSCKDNPSMCSPLIRPCFGGGNYTDYNDSVCSADKIGVLICKPKGDIYDYVHAVRSGSGFEPDGGDCPVQSAIEGFAEADSDGIDRNCDGIIEDNSCQSDNELCAVTSAGPTTNASTINRIIRDGCSNNEDACKCVGKMTCLSKDASEPVCAKNNVQLTTASVDSETCAHLDD
jgi:hypothetical protein